MTIREARIDDIPRIQVIRHSVNENILSDHSLVTNEDCKEYISIKGKGWVCEIEKLIVGFAIADLKEQNIWALFILPQFEGQGIGRQLQKIMLDWYFGQNKKWVWLGTSPNTRAESFYRRSGWKQTGLQANGEIRFEMTADMWASRQLNLKQPTE
jgi:GNAT superfamily N-acetyltransferase